jgi:hypothetical protein
MDPHDHAHLGIAMMVRRFEELIGDVKEVCAGPRDRRRRG